MTHILSERREWRRVLNMSQAQGHILSIYSPSCDTFPVGFQEPHSRKKRKYTENCRMNFAECLTRRHLETLFVLFTKYPLGEGSD